MRLCTPLRVSWLRVLRSTLRERIASTSPRILLSSIVRVRCYFTPATISSTQPFTSSTPTASTIASCPSPGTSSSSTRSSGRGRSPFLSSTERTRWHGCRTSSTGRASTRRSTGCYYFVEANMCAFGRKTPWETDSTRGQTTARSASSLRTVMTSPTLTRIQIS